jgi:hypothetical protein
MDNFSIEQIRKLAPGDAINYIDEYFICLSDGNHAFKYDGEWTIITEDVLKRVYFNRLNNDLNQYYFYYNTRILTPVKDKTKQQFYDDKINFDYKKDTLPTHYKFLVDEFINKKQDIHQKPNDLFKMYQEYGGLLKKTEFIQCLTAVEINPIKNSTNVYKIPFNTLYEIAIKNEWIFKNKYEIEIEKLNALILEKDQKYNELLEQYEIEKNKEVVIYEEVEEEEVEEEIEEEVEEENDMENDSVIVEFEGEDLFK